MSTKDKNAPKVVYGKDGRKMHPNSLKNVVGVTDNSFDKRPDLINKNGRNKDIINVIRQELLELYQQPYWKDKKNKKEQKLLVTKIIQKAIDKYFETDSDGTFLKLADMLLFNQQAKVDQQSKNSAINVEQGVIILPAQNDKVELPQQIDHTEVDDD